MNTGHQVDDIYTDFSKALDRIYRNFLMGKHTAVGIPDSVHTVSTCINQ